MRNFRKEIAFAMFDNVVNESWISLSKYAQVDITVFEGVDVIVDLYEMFEGGGLYINSSLFINGTEVGKPELYKGKTMKKLEEDINWVIEFVEGIEKYFVENYLDKENLICTINQELFEIGG